MEELSHEEQIALARGVIRMLERWGVEPADQLRILGFPEGTRTRALRRFRDDTPFPDEPGVMERVEHLVGIMDALRTTYPRDPALGTPWMRQPHRRFDQRSPLTAMIQDGLAGITAVRAELDCTYAWSRTDPGA